MRDLRVMNYFKLRPKDLWHLRLTHPLYFYRKASLALIRKMVHYSSEVLLKEVCDSDAGHNLPTVLVEITATVLDQEVRLFCSNL